MTFETVTSVKPHDETTLFCCSGMQQYKEKFKDKEFRGVTISNVQPCIRLNDLEEIGDSTHFLYFNMVGLFSFREWTVERTVKFWIEFLSKLGVTPSWVTLHPDKQEWMKIYEPYGLEVRLDESCTWTDGDLGGYCTEFYVDGVEIGNIVNCNGDCIDVGFGLERLEMIVNGKGKNEGEVLRETVKQIIDSGYVPGTKTQGYVLRKLLRMMVVKNVELDHPFYVQEKERQNKVVQRYLRMKDSHPDKPKSWWYDTHGVDIDSVEEWLKNNGPIV